MNKCAFFLDPWDRLLADDSSLYLIKIALALGWETYYFNKASLWTTAQTAYADVFPVRLNTKKELMLGAEIKEQSLISMNRIFMRKDPPFDLEYIYATYTLDLLEKHNVKVLNRPQSIRDANEKFFILNFPKCIPPTLVTSNIEILHAFWETHQNIILKPLDRMAGQNIFHVPPSGENLPVILESLTARSTVTIMAQKYLPEIITLGDKRIILIHGEPLPYALARIPAKGDIRGNLCAGAEGKVVALTPRDHWLCEQIGPTLKHLGLALVGIDVIGDFVTEINVTSPTGLVQIDSHLKDKKLLHRLFE